jgi:hypothetical protein
VDPVVDESDRSADMTGEMLIHMTTKTIKHSKESEREIEKWHVSSTKRKSRKERRRQVTRHVPVTLIHNRTSLLRNNSTFRFSWPKEA